MPLNNPVHGIEISNPKSQSVIAVTLPSDTTAVLIAPNNLNRKGLSIHNASNSRLYLDYSNQVTPQIFAKSVEPNSYFEIPFGYLGSVWGIWENLSGAALIREFI